MSDNPFFTIGIASYNYAHYILHALEQIKKQSIRDFEVLISDDGSNDNSVEVIKEFIKLNPEICIRIIVKENNDGLIANKNTIIENAKGKYLMLCDADDWMSDNYLQIAHEKIIKENPDRLICDVCHIGENDKIIQVEHVPLNQTKWGWLIHHGSFYRMDIIKKYNIRIEAEPDDVYFILNFSKYCTRLSIVNEIHYFWLVHNDSEGRRNRGDIDDKYFNQFYICEKKYVINMLNDINVSHVNGQNEVNERITFSNKIINKDYDELKLVLLKLYYRDILFRLQQTSLKCKIKYYIRLKKYLKLNIPDLWKCKCLFNKTNIVMRSFAIRTIKVCRFLDISCLMFPFLIAYHLITKVVVIDQ